MKGKVAQRCDACKWKGDEKQYFRSLCSVNGRIILERPECKVLHAHSWFTLAKETLGSNISADFSCLHQ